MTAHDLIELATEAVKACGAAILLLQAVLAVLAPRHRNSRRR